jgi:hypothetical protein
MSNDSLPRFQNSLEQFEIHFGYIQKAKDVAEKFSPEVVARVVGGHEQRLQELAFDLMPLVIELESEAGSNQSSIQQIEQRKEAAKITLEELELRHLIGDLDEAAHAEASAPHQKTVEEAEAEVVPHQTQIAALQDALSRWESLGAQSGLLQ